MLVGGLMSYLRYLYSFAYSGLHHILCCVFVFFFLRIVFPILPVSLDYHFLIAPSVFYNVYLSCVLCTVCCQFLWIILFWLPLRYSLTFIYQRVCNKASVTPRVILVDQKLFTLPDKMTSSPCCMIVVSVIRFTASDYLFSILKKFIETITSLDKILSLGRSISGKLDCSSALTDMQNAYKTATELSSCYHDRVFWAYSRK